MQTLRNRIRCRHCTRPDGCEEYGCQAYSQDARKAIDSADKVAASIVAEANEVNRMAAE